MAKAKKTGRGLLSDLEDQQPVKDYDPEEDLIPDEGHVSGSEDSIDEDAGTEHYVNVDKSKLRRKDQVALGPSYRGTRVSRAALDQESEGEDIPTDNEDPREDVGFDSVEDVFDDPETADLKVDQDSEDDAENDSEDAFGESDEEKFKDYALRAGSDAASKKGKSRIKTRPTASDWMASDDKKSTEEMLNGEGSHSDEGMNGHLLDNEAEVSDEDLGEGSESNEDEDSEEDGDLDGFINDESLDGGSESGGESGQDDDKSGLRQSVGFDPEKRASWKGAIAEQRSVTSSLSKALQQEIAKGRAARQQQKIFDALLNIRIRLQKSLVAVNSFTSVDETEDQTEPYKAAETAAIKLWNAIDEYRSSNQTLSLKTGQKRKRTADIDTTNQEVWTRMEDIEQQAIARRKGVLELWSKKMKNMSLNSSNRKSSKDSERPLTSVIDQELDAPERLIRRTRTPRSCAPAQVSRKTTQDPGIFDDADFYSLLLKDLIEQRSGDTSGAALQAASVRFAAVKEVKNKKHIETKASKGRKMRFGVHEKLQNFMAPEDRRGWEQSAIDRLFGTLFGQKMVLDDQDELSDDEMGGVSLEEQGLRLFRN